MLDIISKKSWFCRRFEEKIIELHKKGKIKIPIYISIGSEHVAATLSEVYKNYIVFPQHRCHSYYLCFGGDPKILIKNLLGIDNYNMQGSASVSFDNFYGHSGLLGDQVPIGTGYCLASNKNTLVIMGDAAAEEDYAIASFGYAVTNNLPIVYICEDNNLSILTEKRVRRSWSIVNVARGFGLKAYDINDKVNDIISFSDKANLLNINVNRHYWHAGSGQDNVPSWDRLKELKDYSDEAKEEVENIFKEFE